MTLNISVKHELKELRRDLTKFKRVALPRAQAQALNRTGQQGQSAAVKEISRRAGLKQKDARRAIDRSRAKPARLAVILTGRGRPLNLVRFAARQTRKGVSAAPWRKRRVFRGVWLGQGGRTAFKRVGKTRYPIRPVYGPGIASTLDSAPVRAAVDTAFRERWPVNFKAALKFQLGKMNGKIR